MDGFARPSTERPTTRRTREVKSGPRTKLAGYWIAVDFCLVALGTYVGLRRHAAGAPAHAVALLAASAALFFVDAWRLLTIRRLRRLAAYGRIDRAAVTGVRTTRFSLAPRADGAAPTGGWPIVPAAEISYAFDGGDGVLRRGRFLVATEEAPQFVVGEDVEVFVDRERPGSHVASLVVRWYFRLSSRHVGIADDDPHLPLAFGHAGEISLPDPGAAAEESPAASPEPEAPRR
jgi:hypothetical protein